MTSHILMAIDLLEGSHRLGLKAVKIAHNLGCKLSIVHVVETPITCQYAHALGFAELIEPSVQAASSILATLADELEIPPERQYVRSGKVASIITELAKELNVDTIIIGAHGQHALPQLLGSAANSILNKAHCDVLTIKTDIIAKAE